MRFLRTCLPFIWLITGVTSTSLLPALASRTAPRGSVFGTIDGVNGFPRTLQVMARMAW
jgi:hypothetical protein